MVSKRINIEIPTGLNLRPAGDLCNEASKYNSKIEVHTDKMIANAKSVLNILGACIKMGDVVTIVCEGDDEVEALNAVIEVLEKKVSK